jgi:ribosomal protein L13E
VIRLGKVVDMRRKDVNLQLFEELFKEKVRLF